MPTTFFLGDAEAGTLVPWSTTYTPFGTGGIAAASSTTRFKNGARSWKFMIPSAGAGNNAHYSQLWGPAPQISMGTPSGHFGSGYYSFWLYLDSGWNSTDRTRWNTMLGWMTGTGGAPRPMFDIGIRLPPSGPAVPQLHFHLSSATDPDAGFANTAPTIPGYDLASNGWYFMTGASPSGAVPFPRGQWVHVGVRLFMTPTNGRIVIKQQGVLIMDLTHPSLNLLRGAQGSNPAGDAYLQFGIYGGPDSGDQILYADDFKVTDFEVLPDDVSPPPVVPSGIVLVTAAGGVVGSTPYVDDAQSVGAVKLYSARAIDGLGAVSAWGPWEAMTAQAGTPLAIGCTLPSANGRPSQSGAIGTLVLQEVDPQRRIFTRNFRHRTGTGGPWSTWAAAASLPATDQVPLDVDGGVVEWSVCYIACDGTMQRLTGSWTFDPAGTEGVPPSAGQRTTDVVNFVAGADLIRVQAPPADLTEIDPDWREWKDASGAVRVRGSGRVYLPGNAGLDVVFQYSLDGGTSWAPLGVGEDASYLADGTADDPDDPKGDFIALAGAARTDILTGVFTRGGDADVATILKLGNQKLEFEQLGAGEPDPGGGGDPQTDPEDPPTDPLDPCIPGRFIAGNYTAEADVEADGWVLTLNTSALAINGANIVLDPDDGLPTFKLEYQATTPFVTGGGQLTFAKEFTGLDPTKSYRAVATFKGVQVSFDLRTVLDIEGNGNSHVMTGGEKDGTYQTIQTQTVACQPDGKMVVTFGLSLIQNGDQAHHEIDYFRQIDLVEDGC